jgi:uncharacterized protein YecE (DUF72 family)
MANWHVGTMGFSYKNWLGPFYPPGMPARNFLGHYSQHFNSLEVDTTFYGIPKIEQIERWTAVTPPHFTFCPKTPKAITHELGLTAGLGMMQQFLEVMAYFGDKLGVIVIQFGPDFTAVAHNTLDQFLSQLPHDRRFAVEFRHRSWERPETNELLARYNICRVAADYIHMPKNIQRTADFLYLRFLGRHGQFPTKDKEQLDKTADLQQWLAQIQPHLPQVTDVYAFTNDDYAGFAPATSNRLKQMVGLEVEEVRPLVQARLL